MSLTRANAEAILVKRVGPLLTAADMAVTVVGTNDDLNDPIGRAIRDLGYTVTSVVSIVDADVAQVTESEYDQFLDLATLRTLESILGNYDDVDIRVGPRDEKLSQTVELIEDKIKRLRDALERDYGWGMAVPVARVVTTDFASHGDDTDY